MLDVLVSATTDTLRDILPVALVIAAFQAWALRERPAQLRTILVGLAFLVVGLIMFRFGIHESLLPIGATMAAQLAEPGFVGADAPWYSYGWLLAFAAAIGFSATLIEPTLTAIADRARAVSGGTLHAWEFRLVVAVGVAIGMLIGTLRIVIGVPLPYVFLAMTAIVGLLAFAAPKTLVALAFDSGGVATSVVIVPLIAAFSLSIARSIPGRDPLTDGFGLIMLVFLMPMVTVLGLSILASIRQARPNAGE